MNRSKLSVLALIMAMGLATIVGCGVQVPVKPTVLVKPAPAPIVAPKAKPCACATCPADCEHGCCKTVGCVNCQYCRGCASY